MGSDPGDDDLYDIAPGAPGPVVTPPPRPAARVALSYQSAKTSGASRGDADSIKNLYMPLFLLAGGVVVRVVATVLRSHELSAALLAVGIEIVAGTALMLIGILIAAKLRQIDLGKFWTAVFKLTAVSVAPAAAIDLVTPLLGLIPFIGGLIGWGVEFILYFALLGALFDLDESDTWYCVCVIFIVRIAFYFIMMSFVHR